MSREELWGLLFGNLSEGEVDEGIEQSRKKQMRNTAQEIHAEDARKKQLLARWTQIVQGNTHCLAKSIAEAALAAQDK
jgi:hypothetical protein